MSIAPPLRTRTVNVPVPSTGHPLQVANVPFGWKSSVCTDSGLVAAERSRSRSPDTALNVKQSSSPAAESVPVAGGAPKATGVQPAPVFRRWMAIVYPPVSNPDALSKMILVVPLVSRRQVSSVPEKVLSRPEQRVVPF